MAALGKVTLKSRIPEIQAELGPRVTAALVSGAEQVAGIARENAPEETGTLRRSIKASTAGARRNQQVQIKAAYYWAFLEYGTINMPPQPFMHRSAEQGAPIVELEVAAELRRL